MLNDYTKAFYTKGILHEIRLNQFDEYELSNATNDSVNTCDNKADQLTE